MPEEITILSPEKAVLTYRLAGMGSRIFAVCLDCGIILFSLIVFSIALAIPLGPATAWIAPLLFTAGPFLYFILFEGLWNGRTPGKAALNLRVKSVDGSAITFGSATGRNLLRIADFFPTFGFLGIVTAQINERKQRLGDLVAGTIVVHENILPPNFTPSPHSHGIHALEYVVEGSRPLREDEYHALKRLCDRFPYLTYEAGNRLIQEIYFPIAKRIGVPIIKDMHPIYVAQAIVMYHGRKQGFL